MDSNSHQPIAFGSIVPGEPWAPPRLLLPRPDEHVLRVRSVVAAGELSTRRIVHGIRLVAALDRHGANWWIPAVAVWSDAEDAEHPQRPRHPGLGVGRSVGEAVLSGLTSRLNGEADEGARLCLRVSPLAPGADPIDVLRSLDRIVTALGSIGLELLAVDLSTEGLRTLHVIRVSIQLALLRGRGTSMAPAPPDAGGR